MVRSSCHEIFRKVRARVSSEVVIFSSFLPEETQFLRGHSPEDPMAVLLCRVSPDSGLNPSLLLLSPAECERRCVEPGWRTSPSSVMTSHVNVHLPSCSEQSDRRKCALHTSGALHRALAAAEHPVAATPRPQTSKRTRV